MLSTGMETDMRREEWMTKRNEEEQGGDSGLQRSDGGIVMEKMAPC